ncbi:hypothetical protein Gotur_018572, partial [Gossypium turneri]
MLGVCTPDIHFVYVLPGWEGSIADGRLMLVTQTVRDFLLKVTSQLGEELPSNVIDNDESNIVNTHPSDAWVTWRMELTNQIASSQTSRGIKKKWVPEEDATLVSCMVDLHNVGTFNADMRFKA